MSQGEDVQVVVFRVGGQDFAFDIFQVHRIVPYERSAPLPKAPPFLEGVLQVQGAVVPVIDLRRRFELPFAEAGGETRVIIVDCEGSDVGAVVDAVVEVLRVPVERIAPPPPVVRGLAAHYVQGIVALKGRTVILLHAARILTSAERIALEALATETADG